jgi:hypothetical protein
MSSRDSNFSFHRTLRDKAAQHPVNSNVSQKRSRFLKENHVSKAASAQEYMLIRTQWRQKPCTILQKGTILRYNDKGDKMGRAKKISFW